MNNSSTYPPHHCDLTMDLNKKVAEIVHDAISKLELPPTTTNLIFDHPRTSRFYLLPEIHKSGNPGRPIVSACNFPTELLATSLDMITKPLVENLLRYVKDTNHMHDIGESFRFSGTSNYVFAMDITSLYILIPNNDGLLGHTLNQQTYLAQTTYPFPGLPCLARPYP